MKSGQRSGNRTVFYRMCISSGFGSVLAPFASRPWRQIILRSTDMGQAYQLARFAQFCAEWESSRDVLSRSPIAASQRRLPDFPARPLLEASVVNIRLPAPGFDRGERPLEKKSSPPLCISWALDLSFPFKRTGVGAPGEPKMAPPPRRSNYPAACCIWSTICRSRSAFNSMSRETGLSLRRRKISPCRAGAIVP